MTEGDKTLVEWRATFDVAEADEARLKEQVGHKTFAGGIAALARALEADAERAASASPALVR